jgi:hypothetical protein
MIIKNITLSTIFITALLISHSYTWNMEKNSCQAIVPYTEFNVTKLFNPKKYNAEYNINNSPLVALPLETLERVLSQIDTLDGALITALALRVTCKDFYNLPLEHFGKACQHHDQNDKNKALTELMSKDQIILNYWNGRTKALILKLSDAQEEEYTIPLIEEIISHNDTEALTCLLEKNLINPNQKFVGLSVLFSAKQIDIIEILKKNGSNLHVAGGLFFPNLLWKHVAAYPSPNPKLIAYLLKNLVSAEKIDKANGNCLLHSIGHNFSSLAVKKINDYLETSSLLLEATPKLVNHLNNYDETPIDAIRKHCINTIKKYYGLTHEIKECFGKLISLLKQHGGQTAKQLKKDQKQYQQLVCQIKEFSHYDY